MGAACRVLSLADIASTLARLAAAPPDGAAS
jgi:hypothetical protein